MELGKLKNFLGFSNSYNEASEYPTGQKIVGDEIIIKEANFSSKGFKNYIFININKKKLYIKLKRYAIIQTHFIDYSK